MFTFDGDDGEELCIRLLGPSSAKMATASALAPSSVHEQLNALLGSQLALDQPQSQAKAAQLLMQWLSLPTTGTLLQLVFSQARRELPITRDLLYDDARSEEHRLRHRASLPLAPRSTQMRWSVSGGTPRRPPTATPGRSQSANATPRKRRKSEPTLPVMAFDTPSPQGKPPSSQDDAACNTSSTATATPRRDPRSGPSNPPLSPASEAKASRAAAPLVHSPLSYFGTQPGVSSRFLTVPQGDGGAQAFFDSEAGGVGLKLAPDALLTLVHERFDLPRSIARLVVKRAQHQQKVSDASGGGHKGGGKDKENGNGNDAPALGSPTPGGSADAGGGTGGGAAVGGTPLTAGAGASVATNPADDSGWSGSDAERPVGYAAFYAVYGVHRPEEADKIRIFRLLRRGGSAVVTPSDLTELVWALVETHPGLEFLRDSEEFLKSYVQTTSLRILWALGGAGTQRITLQHWRRSNITEVLFQLDDEGDINLARDHFSYNHFYVIWCIFWELDEDEDTLLQKDDLLRYGAYGLSPRVVDRIFAMRRERDPKDKNGMTYNDFVYFLLAEEDKQAPPALQYWFHVLDVNGDGALDADDMRYFYDEMTTRLQAMDEEVISFAELANELFDIIRPAVDGRVTLPELKKCQIGYNFISALTNVRKYLAWEGLSCEKAAGRASNLRDTRDWDLFADSEYRRLVETEDEGGGGGGGEAEEADAEVPLQSV